MSPLIIQNVHATPFKGDVISSGQNVFLSTIKFHEPLAVKDNLFQSEIKSIQHTLKDMCKLFSDTPEQREYFEYLDKRQREIENKKKAGKAATLQLNAMHIRNAPLQILPILIGNSIYTALIDTGASVSLIHSKLVPHILSTPFAHQYEQISVNLICAGGAISDAVSAKIRIQSIVYEFQQGYILLDIPFLVCSSLGEWDIIIGNDVLLSKSYSPLIGTGFLTLFNIPNKSKIAGTTNHNDGYAPIHINLNNVSLGTASVLPLLTFQKQLCPYVAFAFRHARIPAATQGAVSVNIPQCKDILTPNDVTPCRSGKISVSDIIYTKFPEATAIIVYLNNISPHDVEFDCLEPVFFVNNYAHNDISLNTLSPDITMDEDELINKNILLPDNMDKHFQSVYTELPDLSSPEPDRDLTFKDGDFSECSPQQKNHLYDVLGQFPEVFSRNKYDVGVTDYLEYFIQIDHTKPLTKQMQRPIPAHKLKKAQEAVKVWIQQGIVEICDNPQYVSNLLFIPKAPPGAPKLDNSKAGKYRDKVNIDKKKSKAQDYRIAIDYRVLNSCIANNFMPPAINTNRIIASLHDKLITSIDLNSAYFNIKIAPESIPLTCFYLDNEIYGFKRCSFGLSTAPTVFLRLINMTFSPEVYGELFNQLLPQEQQILGDANGFPKFVVHYFDDIFLFSEDDIEKHAVCLKMVLMALKRAGLKIGPQKTKYFARKVKVLGYTVNTSENVLQFDFTRASAFLNWPKPANCMELNSRLQSLNYFEKFLPMLRTVAGPLYLVIRSKTFYWGTPEDNAWKYVKALIFLDIKLSLPTEDDRLFCFSDASKLSCSQLLFKLSDNNILSLAAAHSKIFNASDSKREIYFKEAMSLCLAFKAFLPYLECAKEPPVFFVDSKNLIFLSRNKDRSILANNLITYIIYMTQAFRFQVFYLSSFCNHLADLLSRYFCTSRFLSNQYACSKEFTIDLPEVDKFIANSDLLYIFLTSECDPAPEDLYNRSKTVQRPLHSVFQQYNSLTPEHAFISSFILLRETCRNIKKQEVHNIENALLFNVQVEDINLQTKDWGKLMIKGSTSANAKSFQLALSQIVTNIMDKVYGGGLQISEKARVRDSLLINARKLLELPIYYLCDGKEIRYKKFAAPNEILHSAQAHSLSDFLQEVNDTILCNWIIPDESSPATNHQVVRYLLLNGILHIEAPKQGGSLPPPLLSACFEINTLVKGSGNVHLHVFDIYLIMPQSVIGYITVYTDYTASVEIIQPVLYPDYFGPLTLFMFTEIPSVNIHSVRIDFYPFSKTPSPNFLLELQPFTAQDVFDLNFSKHRFDSLLLYNMPFTHYSNMPATYRMQEPETYWSNKTHQFQNASRFMQLYTLQINESVEAPPANTEIAKATEFQNLSREQQGLVLQEALAKIAQTSAACDIDYLSQNKLTKQAFQSAQKTDELSGHIFNTLENGQSHPPFELINGLLYKNTSDKTKLLVLPIALLPSFCVFLHRKFAHCAASHLRQFMGTYFFNPLLRRTVNTITEGCITCKICRFDFPSLKSVVAEGRTFKPSGPGDYVALDIIPNLPPATIHNKVYTELLVLQDIATGYSVASPMENKSYTSILHALIVHFSSHPLPTLIKTDQESSILRALKELRKYFPFKIVSSIAFNHHQNQSEISVKLIKKTMTKLIYNTHNPEGRENWIFLLPLTMFVINHSFKANSSISRAMQYFNQNFITKLFADEELNKETFGQLDLAPPTTIDPVTDGKRHEWKPGALVLTKSYQKTPLGVKKALQPKNTLELFKIIDCDENSHNVKIQNLSTGQFIYAHSKDLTALNPAHYFSQSPDLIVDSEIFQFFKGKQAGKTPVPQLFPFEMFTNDEEVLVNNRPDLDWGSLPPHGEIVNINKQKRSGHQFNAPQIGPNALIWSRHRIIISLNCHRSRRLRRYPLQIR